jgi:protein OS-9
VWTAAAAVANYHGRRYLIRAGWLLFSRMLPLALATLILSIVHSSGASRSSSIPEDIHAFPKFKIQFLNSRPLLNYTAQHWLQHGLVDENEFLGLPKASSSSTNRYKKIAGGPADTELATSNTAADDAQAANNAPLPELKQMRLGAHEFLCLLLPPPDLPAPPEEAQQAPQPIHSWELLQPLEGTCLYVSPFFNH